MNPGLVVKLRPAGPWRIGPDSGARNRVDVIYHSDSLYSRGHAAPCRAWACWRNGWTPRRAPQTPRGVFQLVLSRFWMRLASWCRRARSGRRHRRR